MFCGASPGAREGYGRAAGDLAEAMAARGDELVYGGGRVGMMGLVADAALARGVRVTGVIPRAMAVEEVAHSEIDDLRLVASMHERKALMTGLSDAVMALPGGLGTLDELFEALTWAQLGLHDHPVALLNTLGYWDPLVALIARAGTEGFLRTDPDGLLLVGDDPGEVLAGLELRRRSARGPR